MLKSLSIENIAIIEKADIEFSSGFNAMTGETGAGKSIIVDSINSILGERTSKELVRHGATSASVTAVFDDINESVKQKLDEIGVDIDDEDLLVVSRKISSQGKSSCRINGTPCSVSMLKDIGSTLVNIHGQHDSQALLNPDYHYKFVDMYGGNDDTLRDYQSAFKELISIRRRLKALTSDADTKDRQLELLNYQIKELSNADIKIGEKDELKQRKNVLVNSQSILNSLNAVLSSINGDDEAMGISNLLSSSKRELSAVADVDDEMRKIDSSIDESINSVESLKDIVLAKINSINFDEKELEIIDDRLDLYYNLSNKYGNTEQDMLNYLENAIKERDSIVNSDEEIEKLSTQYDDALNTAMACADILSCYRKSLAYQLEKDVKEQLEFLDMPKIQFIVDFQKGNMSSTGYDRIEFLISTNLGEPPKPLAKIASGGELSRIMLAIKNIIAKNDTIDTLIFDEIDTGVSGRASRKIGLKLKSVSQHSQVICVTHSAQIASIADNHLLISKSYFDDQTYTSVTPLDFNGRKRELARIMGGLDITPSLLKSAEELLNEK